MFFLIQSCIEIRKDSRHVESVKILEIFILQRFCRKNLEVLGDRGEENLKRLRMGSGANIQLLRGLAEKNSWKAYLWKFQHRKIAHTIVFFLFFFGKDPEVKPGSASVVPADSDSVVPADSVSVVPAAVWVVRSTTVPPYPPLSMLKSVLLLTCTLSSPPHPMHPTPPFCLIYAQVCLAPDLYVIIPTPPHPTLVGITEPKF